MAFVPFKKGSAPGAKAPKKGNPFKGKESKAEERAEGHGKPMKSGRKC